ncbi:hypothetical protein L4D00_24010 [Photobacterium swingsii]|uniref:hypothetical protein n=1 Tax=Photobacterium swingsii TaxID=680026 RepID=UPI003D0B3658
MKYIKALPLFILCIIMIYTPILQGISDVLVYKYFRIKQGTEFVLNDVCYIVPDGWIFGGKVEAKHSYVRLLKNPKYVDFVDVYNFSFSELPNKDALIMVDKKVNNYDVYEMSHIEHNSNYKYFAPLIEMDLFLFSDHLDIIKNNAFDTILTECTN